MTSSCRARPTHATPCPSNPSPGAKPNPNPNPDPNPNPNPNPDPDPGPDPKPSPPPNPAPALSPRDTERLRRAVTSSSKLFAASTVEKIAVDVLGPRSNAELQQLQQVRRRCTKGRPAE